MTKRIGWLLCGLALVAAAAWAGNQDFTLVNRTGLTISELYVSSADVDEWEEDILGVDVLPDGESVDIHFAPKERAKVWDLMIVDEDGDQVVWQGLRLDKIRKVTLRYDKKGNPVADLE
jgi:hypothetical protein